MKKAYTPLRYPGGKSQFYNNVLSIIESNNIKNFVYIEPFAGGAGIALRLLFEGIANKVVINDIDIAVYSFWHTVLYDTDWLIEKIIKTPITIYEWKKQKAVLLNSARYSVSELGFATLFLNRCNRSGILFAGPIGGMNQNGKYKMDCRFNKNSIISLIRKISQYKNKINIFNYDAKELIDKFGDDNNIFWFIDPPYYVKGKELYKNSFAYGDHLELSNIIKNKLKNKKWILTYDVCDDILDLYGGIHFNIISLNYYASVKRKENELMFYNNLLISDCN